MLRKLADCVGLFSIPQNIKHHVLTELYQSNFFINLYIIFESFVLFKHVFESILKYFLRK